MAVIGSVLGTVGSAIASGASAAGGAIASGASAAGGAIASGVSAAGGAIASGLGAVKSAIGEMAAEGAKSSFVQGAADGLLSSGKSAIVRDASGGIQWGETAEKVIGNAAGSA